MLAADLLARFLLAEFEKNPSRTIVFWSDKWHLSIDELVRILRDHQRLSRKHSRIWEDVSFTREDYDGAEQVLVLSDRWVIVVTSNLKEVTAEIDKLSEGQLRPAAEAWEKTLLAGFIRCGLLGGGGFVGGEALHELVGE